MYQGYLVNINLNIKVWSRTILEFFYLINLAITTFNIFIYIIFTAPMQSVQQNCRTSFFHIFKIQVFI